MSRYSDNKLLVDSGLSADNKAADALRKRITESGQSVAQYIKANTQETVFGPAGLAEKAGSTEMLEIRALMDTEGLSYAEAKILFEALARDGRTVDDYLQAESIGVRESNSPLAVFRKVGELIKLTGSKEKAFEAIEAFTSLSATAPAAPVD